MFNPFRAVKNKVEKTMTDKVIGLVIRHVLTAAGLTGVLGESEINQVAGAIAVIVGIAWSVWEKRDNRKS